MKRNFILQISDSTREDFSKVAEAGHMADTKFAAVIVEEFATLKPEFALKALAMIPPEWKHRRPGRPSAPATVEISKETKQEVA